MSYDSAEIDNYLVKLLSLFLMLQFLIKKNIG